MPRKETPLTGELTPVRVFALQLRAVRQASGRTYREMESDGNYDHTTFSRAAGGESLPRWDHVVGFLAGNGICGELRLRKWRKLWSLVHELEGVASRNSAAGTQDRLGAAVAELAGEISTKDAGAAVMTAASLRRSEIVLRLRQVRTRNDLGAVLRRLLRRYGRKSYAELRAMTGIPTSTLCGWFTGQTPPSLDGLLRLVTALGADDDEQDEFVESLDRIQLVDRGYLVAPDRRNSQIPAKTLRAILNRPLDR